MVSHHSCHPEDSASGGGPQAMGSWVSHLVTDFFHTRFIADTTRLVASGEVVPWALGRTHLTWRQRPGLGLSDTSPVREGEATPESLISKQLFFGADWHVWFTV